MTYQELLEHNIEYVAVMYKPTTFNPDHVYKISELSDEILKDYNYKHHLDNGWAVYIRKAV